MNQMVSKSCFFFFCILSFIVVLLSLSSFSIAFRHFCVSFLTFFFLDDSFTASKENISANLLKKTKKSLPYSDLSSSTSSRNPFLLSYNGHHDDGHYADSIYERKFIDEVRKCCLSSLFLLSVDIATFSPPLCPFFLV
jgi:hypothetical protein